MLLWLIVACEIGFWIVLLLGLIARYLFQWRKTGSALLLCVPLSDIILLIATGVDLYRGTIADFSHGLAAAYLGFTIAFGKSMIRWADQKFAYRFASGPVPWRPPTHGWAYTLYEWKLWARALVACSITCGILISAILIVNKAEQTESLIYWFLILGWTLGVWLVFGPLWYTVFPKKENEGAST